MTSILVTRPAGQNDPLVSELESRGYRVHPVPTVATRPLAIDFPDLDRFDWIVLTSSAGVDSLPSTPRAPRWAAVGGATAAALGARGAEVDFVPDEATGEALAETLPDPAGARVLVVRGSLADPVLPTRLRERGAQVEEITAYETVEGPDVWAEALRRALDEPDLVAVVFASGSAVRGFLMLGGDNKLPAITIGPLTSAAAREAGFRVAAEAASPNVQRLADAVQRAFPLGVGSAEVRPAEVKTDA